jgi:hypothetical protein
MRPWVQSPASTAKGGRKEGKEEKRKEGGKEVGSSQAITAPIEEYFFSLYYNDDCPTRKK